MISSEQFYTCSVFWYKKSLPFPKTYATINLSKKNGKKETPMKIILASGSPRRKELLTMMGLNFETKTSQKEENLNPQLSIKEQCKQLAYQKARDVLDQIPEKEDCFIIGSDTMVVKAETIYGKPKSKEDAFSMINQLQGASHEVYTSLCVIVRKQGKEKQYITLDTTKVHLKEMSNQEIEMWLAKKEWKDKAGAYAIQGFFSVFISKIEGNFYSVMGLPIHQLYEIMKQEKLM
jgi:septum formation protein